MPASLIALTEGSGKNLDTFQRVIGSNTVEDQVVLLGENNLVGYTVTTISGAAASTATAASHLLQIMAGASLKVRIRRIEVHQATLATTVAYLDLRLVRLTTAGTGGTAIVPQPLDTGDAGAGATSMVLPTVKGTEAGTMGSAVGYMMQTLGASAQQTNPIAFWDFDRPRSKPLILAAGVTLGLAIKNANAVAAGTVNIMVWLDESNFS